MTDAPDLPFFARLWLAWAAFFGVLADGRFAGRVAAARQLGPATGSVAGSARATASRTATETAPDVGPALRLLGLLQREGRLVDFLEQDVASFADAEVGAAARVVHDGCRKALRAHARVEAVRPEGEGDRVTLAAGFDAGEVKLVGDVRGQPPYSGTVRHRGWRVRDLELPRPVGAQDATVVAPAEVELGS